MGAAVAWTSQGGAGAGGGGKRVPSSSACACLNAGVAQGLLAPMGLAEGSRWGRRAQGGGLWWAASPRDVPSSEDPQARPETSDLPARPPASAQGPSQWRGLVRMERLLYFYLTGEETEADAGRGRASCPPRAGRGGGSGVLPLGDVLCAASQGPRVLPSLPLPDTGTPRVPVPLSPWVGTPPASETTRGPVPRGAGVAAGPPALRVVLCRRWETSGSSRGRAGTRRGRQARARSAPLPLARQARRARAGPSRRAAVWVAPGLGKGDPVGEAAWLSLRAAASVRVVFEKILLVCF